ncbi:hypothetical protein ACX3VT_03885 [Aerococcus sanguinicola]|uniref:hypothetical protein n=1 Tax=unclassified Aerococcus TaxID=2618060 RepID=UPI0008A58442|nr:MULTISPECIES: hypothetical protein [unclassified Aerococcus]KAB0646777.1 hypothetical protein F6I01_05300 [Aerococcus sanguinicola]MDK6234280.1 hypothetical protein [Aerococcus sp. UMB10185]MDK6855496.1 hypothetical protein [Aerococcus sp. UMB7533]MDK8503289.1 hypothetical protein [Aerococcus sp. UMB1112A]OFN00548.1 hypothetical protein HMPREF2626_08780 [Aerococcus sp. HMSC062A02]
MGLFSRIQHLFQSKEPATDPVEPERKKAADLPQAEASEDWIERSGLEPEEACTVAAIATACVTGARSDTVFRIKSIEAVDLDQELAGILTACILAHDQEDSHYRVKRIERIS